MVPGINGSSAVPENWSIVRLLPEVRRSRSACARPRGGPFPDTMTQRTVPMWHSIRFSPSLLPLLRSTATEKQISCRIRHCGVLPAGCQIRPRRVSNNSSSRCPKLGGSVRQHRVLVGSGPRREASRLARRVGRSRTASMWRSTHQRTEGESPSIDRERARPDASTSACCRVLGHPGRPSPSTQGRPSWAQIQRSPCSRTWVGTYPLPCGWEVAPVTPSCGPRVTSRGFAHGRSVSCPLDPTKPDCPEGRVDAPAQPPNTANHAQLKSTRLA